MAGGSARLPARAGCTSWLLAPGSLSQRLAQTCPPFGVRLLRQGRAPAWDDEPEALQLPACQALCVREVLLLAGGGPALFARSVTSMAAASGAWRAIQGLGQRPLAHLLFDRREIRRSPIHAAWLPAAHPQARTIARRWRVATGQPLPARGLWRRDSVFWRAGQPLRVAEYFLPATLARLIALSGPLGQPEDG